ncbi:ATP-dependent helicase upf1 [Grifola frondosa]|uniref:ATP-dependent helicase upf1 n=1 Tax=Grifola frondosa TaxID=5627 RepID=A0A1C7LMT3_GRIFR|nr:ATP-dependent helicase upf1 [Grifola frondosa]
MPPVVLRDNPTPEDDSWNFRATVPIPRRTGMGKHVTFTAQAIKIDLAMFPANRILHSDDPSKFILASFESLRFPERPPSTNREYMVRLFKAGFFLNGVQYRFYGHSPSQLLLSSRGEHDEELDDRLYRLGDFQRIMNVAKRAKRIGPLFSKAEIDWQLDPRLTKDVDTEDTRQNSYHEWVRSASTNWEVAFDFLSALKQYESAERLLFEGIDSQRIQAQVRSAQMSEVGSFVKNDKFRARMIIPKSRFLYGVCDPYGVLREGEVHVRVSIPRQGASTLKNTQVLIVRNPCLHPGDCLKLWAVEHPRLSHLVDCVVFASKGRRAAPSMSAGGDLDGDQFTVIWDPDFVPKKVAEVFLHVSCPKRAYQQQCHKRGLRTSFCILQQACIMISCPFCLPIIAPSMTLARIVALHHQWVRFSPKGAMSNQCQDLNALHSLAVDGGSVKIPEHLTRLPEVQPDSPPYIIALLQQAAREFHDDFLQSHPSGLPDAGSTEDAERPPSAEERLVRLMASEKLAISEYELVMMAARFARRHNMDLRPHLCHIDFGALTTSEKHALSVYLGLTPESDPYMWNSLIRSEILQPRDLEDRHLGGPLRLQRLYSSSIQGRAAFFRVSQSGNPKFQPSTNDSKDDRFSVGVFLRGEIAWDDDPEVDNNVVVCSFMPRSSGMMSTYWQGTKGYKLHCGENVMQLFNKQRGDSFIFVTRPPAKSGIDIVTSIALNKISGRVQQQCGRVYRTPVVTIEIHVVSNRDRIAHQIFDLRFEHVQTEELLKRFDYTAQSFTPNTLVGIDWSHDPVGRRIFINSVEDANRALLDLDHNRLRNYFKFAIQHRAESRIFLIFEAFLGNEESSLDMVAACMEEYPSLAYSVLKKHLPEGPGPLPQAVSHLAPPIIRNIIRSSNSLGIAALAGLERLASNIDDLDVATFFDILWLTSLSVRPPELVQEILLVLHEGRTASRSRSKVLEYAHKNALGIAFDRAEEAGDACAFVPPKAADGQEMDIDAGGKITVTARIRVDAPTPIRIHSHIRLQVASSPEGSPIPRAVVDAVVTRASRGELWLDVKQPLPPEWKSVDWNLYDAGSTATSKAMMDAVLRLARDGRECCRFNHIIVGLDPIPSNNGVRSPPADDQSIPASLNASQRAAVLSAKPDRLTLIWGPPGMPSFLHGERISNPARTSGTGKTTVVVQILLRFLREDSESKILMSASTHNAVDNVLERFLQENDSIHLLTHEQILRVATESSKVHKQLQKFTVDSRLGGSLNDNPRLIQKAEKRVKEARIVFTTCTGAGLGILRNIDFETVLIDEASQITEPGALIPLVKGCRGAVMVGDHVQLRPTVRPMGKALEFDKSLFESLWTGQQFPDMSRAMLEVQYRFSADVARFPSQEFYEGRLQTGTPREDEIAATLGISSFPWPHENGRLFPVVFIPCTSEEDYGRASKSNSGQVNLVKYILSQLRTPRNDIDTREEYQQRLRSVSIAVLTPYSRQVQLLRQNLPSAMDAVVSTIDGFQGREADVVVFSTVRSNAEGDIGFVEDARRLNVAWTRPKLGLIVVGNRNTLQATSTLWKRASEACKEVVIEPPEETVS